MGHEITIFLLILFIKLIQYTNLKKIHGEENLEKAKKMSEHGNYAIAVWHQDLNTVMFTCEKPMTTMGSKSKDGDLAVRTSASVGMKAVRGSSSRGGTEALKELIDLTLKENIRVGLTVDGPRGPARKPKRGIFAIAHTCKIPVVPYISIASRRKTLERSWDKTRVPLPFGTLHHCYGEPIMIESLDEEAINKYSQHIITEVERMEKELLALM
jgi:lysophospholipid acyltransferase (LPLAT)-like uncharacterized protein